MPAGGVTFPGVHAAQYLSGSESWGTSPDVFQLWIQPQVDTVASTGTLAWAYDGVGCSLANCLVFNVYYKQSTRGLFQVLSIKDRRWAWQMNTVNLRLTEPATVRSLAAYLFTIMGEPTANVSAIDLTDVTIVNWDHRNAAYELEAMLTRFGYCISPNGNGPAKVYKVGTGTALPANGDVTNVSFSLSAAVLPNKIRIICDDTRVQSKLGFEAVGEDTDGTLKPIADLSYEPVGGWGAISDWTKMAEITNPTARALALKTVGKLFRLKFQADGTFDITDGVVNYVGGEITVTDYTQMLPLTDRLLETETNSSGELERKRSYVEASTYDDDKPTANSPLYTRIENGWELDPYKGTLLFDKLMLKKTFTTGGLGDFLYPTDIFYICSYSIHPLDTMVKDRLATEITPGGTGIVELDGDDMYREIICRYGAGDTAITLIDENKTAIQAAMALRLTAALRNYTSGVRTVVFYRRIYQFTTDGITQQVIWRAGMFGTPSEPPYSTTCSQNMESHPHLIRRKERARRMDLQRRNTPESNRVKDQKNKRLGKID
jgi:hypothetical protein